MKISRLEVFVIGDGQHINPNQGGEPLACLKVHTDAGLTGLSEVFRVPPSVVQATVGDAKTDFGRLLTGHEMTHPQRLWLYVWDALIHTNRRNGGDHHSGIARYRDRGPVRTNLSTTGLAASGGSAARPLSNDRWQPR